MIQLLQQHIRILSSFLLLLGGLCLSGLPGQALSLIGKSHQTAIENHCSGERLDLGDSALVLPAFEAFFILPDAILEKDERNEDDFDLISFNNEPIRFADFSNRQIASRPVPNSIHSSKSPASSLARLLPADFALPPPQV